MRTPYVLRLSICPLVSLLAACSEPRLLNEQPTVGASAAVDNGSGYPATQYRYKLELEVNDNGRVLSGESVIEVKWQYLRGSGTLGNVFDAYARGDAVVVDFGDERGSLFALLGNLSDRDGSTFRTVDTPAHALAGTTSRQDFMTSYPDNDLRWQAIVKGAASTEEVVLSPEQLPSFVRFADTLDPKTVHQILASDFEKEFGPGVTFKRMTIQVTDEPVVERMRSLLPWLEQLDQRPFPTKPRHERTTYEQLREPLLRQ